MPDPIIVPKEVEVAPVQVTLIGTGPGTDMQGMTGVTPEGNPNLIVTSVITPLVAIIVRFLHLYFVTLSGIVASALTPYGSNLISHSDFFDLLFKCALLSLSGPIIGAIKDLVTIFGRLEGKFPLLTGNI